MANNIKNTSKFIMIAFKKSHVKVEFHNLLIKIELLSVNRFAGSQGDG